MNERKIGTMLKPKEGKSESPPKAVGSGRWADCCLLTAPVLPERIFARPGIPGSAWGTGPSSESHHTPRSLLVRKGCD